MTAAYPCPHPSEVLPPVGLTWLDAHAATVLTYLTHERDWLADHPHRYNAGMQPPLPWAQALVDWLEQSPEAFLGPTQDPRQPERIGTWLAWLSTMAHVLYTSPIKAWTHALGQPDDVPLALPEHLLPLEHAVACAVAHGVSLGQIVPVHPRPQPLWQVLAQSRPDWTVLPPGQAAINPPRWALEHAPQLWDELQRHTTNERLVRVKNQGGPETAEKISRLFQSAGVQAQKSYCWLHWAQDDGTPLMWTAVNAAPRWILTTHEQSRRADTFVLPDQFWAAKNAQGRDLWFAALESYQGYGDALSVKVVERLARLKTPEPDAQGRGWIVAQPSILRQVTQSRSGGNSGCYPLRGKLRALLAQHPEWAFAGTVEQHAALADEVWNRWVHSSSHARALVELAQWGALLPVHSPVMTEPLRGLLIEAIGYALDQPTSSISNQANILWTSSEKDALRPALLRLIDHRAWRIPPSTPGSSLGVLAAHVPIDPTWSCQRQEMWAHYDRIEQRQRVLDQRPVSAAVSPRRRRS